MNESTAPVAGEHPGTWADLRVERTVRWDGVDTESDEGGGEP